MQKFFAILILGCFVSNTAFATACAGGAGTVVNGKTSGTFCKSNVPMNWWSTFTWCQASSMQVASWDGMCPEITAAVNNTSNACPNLNLGNNAPLISGTSNAWVYPNIQSTTSGKALRVNLVNGVINEIDKNRTNAYTDAFAFCQMN